MEGSQKAYAWADSMIVLSHHQIAPLLARGAGLGKCRVSLDLNLTKVECEMTPEGLMLPVGLLELASMKKIAKDENGCFLADAEGENVVIHKIQAYSEDFARTYSLYPTASAPSMRVSGFPMHRIKDTDPWLDTQEKLKTIGAIKGEVLDTTTGLGYTAILAAKKATKVTTIEIDSTATEICRYNPWSRALFTEAITQLYGDAFEVVDTLESTRFDAVIHDPPTKQLAGELYSEEFYGKVKRILRPKGRFFHYIGDPESPFGKSMTEGVIRRLKYAGYRTVERHPAAFGVVASG